MSKSDIFSKEVYFKAIEESDSGLWIYDVPAGSCFLSDRYYKMLGYEPGEFEGKLENLFALLHPDDVEPSNKVFADFFGGSLTKYRNEVRLRNKSNGYTYILTQGYGERNEAGEVIKIVGWNIDITPLKTAQLLLDEERSKSAAQSRLAQLGLLSAGLTHEINNPLMAIRLRSQLMLKTIDKGMEITTEKLQTFLNSIMTSAGKIENIVNALRSIAEGGNDEQKEIFILNKVLEDVLMLSQVQFKDHRITVEIDAPEEISINGNNTLIAQVFLNLINNSIDALENQTSRMIKVKLTSKNNEAIVSFLDNGNGIEEKLRDKIFLPFYTTKDPGKGTGLGLSISSSIIQAHKGTISYSYEQGWSLFTVKIPLA